jgi:lipopolysaccharide/colanic/teichoic acid biosynthesis glycosyltransferase
MKTGSLRKTGVDKPLYIVWNKVERSGEIAVSYFTLKRMMDLTLAVIALVALSPVFLFCILGVSLSSQGGIFYIQERAGRYGKPFRMLKFRSMYKGAENGVPVLSYKGDPWVTPFGKYIRRFHLDELPQFFNVLKGEMSLVGPRPERQYFINQIMELAPHYPELLSVKPGLTSLGQLQYGYAFNVGQMVERMKYDIYYLEHQSVKMDINVIFQTIKHLIKGMKMIPDKD